MWDLWPAISLKEVKDESVGAKYFLFLNKHDAEDDYLRISLLDGTDAYIAELTPDDVKGMSSKSRISLPDFTKLSVSALTCENLTNDAFVYGIDKRDKSLQLTWKKVIPEESFKIKLGSLSFQAVSNANEVCNTLQQLSKYVIEKNQELATCQDQKRQLEATNRQLSNILEKEIVSKDKIEEELYTKFVLVLNKKKEKCREYKEKLAGLKISQASRSETSDRSPAEGSPTKTRKTNTGLLFEDSSDDSMPVLTQRVVKNKRAKKTAPAYQESVKQKKNTSRSSETIWEADTQELMDDL